MKAYKGFDKNLKCRGFQYEVGKTYEEKNAKLCETGFHACEAPLNVMDYYPPHESRYCEVELDNVSKERSDDTKVVGKKITIGAEIGIPGLVKAHVEWVKEQVKECDELAKDASGYAAQIGSSGDAAQIGSSGYAAKIGSSGRYAKIGSSGDAAQIGSSGDDAQIGSSGRYAKIGSSGDDVAISCECDHAVAVCAGKNGKVKGPVGTWIALAEYGKYDGEGYPCIGLKAAMIDGEKLKADTWYMIKNGEFVEVEENDDLD